MFLVYGANGYTGELIAREAARRGLAPCLAGRGPVVNRLAAELGLEARTFGLDDPEALRRGLAGAKAVLHCAGPFVRTHAPMLAACLAAGVHYLDITGEIAVFESAFRRREEAVRAGIVVLPGVGFDVVPTDCLAARLKARLPEAESLELAFCAGARASRGTLKTVVEGLPAAGAIRRDGHLVQTGPAHLVREIPFSCGTRTAASIPWGDLATAYRTTGIPNIRVFSAMTPAAVRRLRRAAPLLPLLGLRPVKRLLQAWIERTVRGPSEAERRSGRTWLWGEVTDARGETRSETLEIPEGYTFTAAAAAECARRVAAGELEPGVWTPAGAFGAELLDEVLGLMSASTSSPRSAP